MNGDAIGAGLCLALACDVRVVGEEAKLGLRRG
jgi:enoyl-CoA hydratase/carnithine racemase